MDGTTRTNLSVEQPYADGIVRTCTRCQRNNIEIPRDKLWFQTDDGKRVCEDCVKSADPNDREFFG